MKSINNINQLNKSDFLSIFGNIFEKTEWIAEKVFDLKPFKSNDDLFSKMIDQYDQETVDAFLAEFDLMDIEHLEDAYYGQYDSGAEFAESFVSDCYGLPSEMPYWIAIDWEETWSNLEYDYSESNGYIFCNHW